MENCPQNIDAVTAPKGVVGYRFPAHQRGFTLIELMIVLVIAAVLLGVTGPAFQDSLQRSRIQSGLNSVVAGASFARSEAAIRVTPVAMCPTVDTNNCSGSNWETGWIVFVDDAGDGSGTASDGIRNGGEELLRIGGAAGNGVTIRTAGFINNSSLVFTDVGRPAQDATGTFRICDGRGAADASALIINVSGQARIAVDSNGSGVVQDHTIVPDPLGVDIACP